MKDTTELEEMLKGVLASQKLAVIATQKEGQPFTNLVAFVATDDLKHLLFATTRATRKFANLRADKKVALLVDNRRNQASDFSNAVAVTVFGRAAEVEEVKREYFLGLYLAKHSHLRGFATAPTCALVKVDIEKYEVVQRFQNVLELRVRP
ncbi:MAG: pyridoxamine 5'-phosphate oxidase family protein [Thermodesulfobacteriota bacterium]|nr:pyridoxamine 5'-phosphate oxidase family protein [Thermodesulfobacteriota bacterium]